jgi:hypothetical protein
MRKEDLARSEEAHHQKVAALKLMRVPQSTHSKLTLKKYNSQNVKGVQFAIGMHIQKKHA